MIYYKDAAMAAHALLAAPPEKIKMVNYNVGGIRRVTPREIEAALREHLAGVNITYEPPPALPAGPREILWNDSTARDEWGWSPEYTAISTLVADFVREMKQLS